MPTHRPQQQRPVSLQGHNSQADVRTQFGLAAAFSLSPFRTIKGPPMRLTAYPFLLATLLCGASATAQTLPTAADLAKASGCYSCHAHGEKLVGPSFAAIAEKYASEKDAAASLAQSIKNGSKGKWGRVPMPPHASLSGDELKLLSTWVLTIKP